MTPTTSTTTYRPELNTATMPDWIARLPVHRGYPVPWFVATLEDGTPEFRAMDRAKWNAAVKEGLCWVCGERLGANRVFVIGPMCGVNRTTTEPPNHADCAEWSAINCPFLSRPTMVRREDGIINNDQLVQDAPGFALTRNPGVALLWWTKTFTLFKPGVGGSGYLFQLGEPYRVRWYAEGRPATRAEVVASIDGGLPKLREMCDAEPMPWDRRAAHAQLEKARLVLTALYPDD